jgi:4-aminobutyrate aminotransferase
VIARDSRVTSPSYTRFYPLVIDHGSGCVVEDVDGNRFLDFTAGIAVCATGHCHPRVVAAVQAQSERLLHMCGADFYYEPLADLAEKLAALAPGPAHKRVFFTNSGAEAIEAAFKLARFATRRTQMIAFYGGFHGRTFGAMSLTGSKAVQRAGFAPLVPGVHHVPFPDCFRCKGRPYGPDGFGHTCEKCSAEAFEALETLLRRTVPADEVAAVIVEPIQGEGGYLVPPLSFHRRLKELCARHGILYIADEVQSGMGRTGRMFASEHFGVVPDILCLAKGIASGLPLGAIIAREDLMTWGPGSHANTFGGNPLACVAALETIDLLEEGLTAAAAELGPHLMSRLRDVAARQPLIGDVRGMGLMVGVELVRDRLTKERATHEREAVLQAAFRRGLVLLGCGESTIRFCPGLVVKREQIDTAVQIFEEALADAK